MQVALLERLDEIRQRAGVPRLLDQVVLRERGEDEHRAQLLARDRARRGEAVHPRHLDVEDGEVGLGVAHEIDGLVAAAGLADDFVALFLEDLLDVEPDDGFVLGEHDRTFIGRPVIHSAMLSARRSRRHAVEQVVLLLLELADRSAERVALPALRVGVAAHLVRLGVGERRLRHERPEPGVLGFGVEERALLVGDREFGAQPLEPIAHVDQAALEQGPGHEAESLRRTNRRCDSVFRP